MPHDTPLLTTMVAGLGLAFLFALLAQRLRLARRIAQKRGIAAASDIEAVYRLREAGIDPFSRSSVLGLVAEKARDAAKDAGRVAGKALARIDTAGRELEGKPPEGPPPVHTPQSGALEILEIQRDILRRRRRRLIALAVRLVVFVVLPTILMAYYYTAVATPLYASKSDFVIQQADAPSARGGSLVQTSPMATPQDAMTVQGFNCFMLSVVFSDEEAWKYSKIEAGKNRRISAVSGFRPLHVVATKRSMTFAVAVPFFEAQKGVPHKYLRGEKYCTGMYIRTVIEMT